MTPEDFRQLALRIPGAEESAHQGHPDFRIKKKVFATLNYPKPGWAMVKVNTDQREMLMAADPDAFSPVPGGWGKTGATLVCLQHATHAGVESALGMAGGIVMP